jgi:hypothetical protein
MSIRKAVKTVLAEAARQPHHPPFGYMELLSAYNEAVRKMALPFQTEK